MHSPASHKQERLNPARSRRCFSPDYHQRKSCEAIHAVIDVQSQLQSTCSDVMFIPTNHTVQPWSYSDGLQHANMLQDIEPELTADSKDFKVAVARTRQAVSVQKAIGFMDASSPAKYTHSGISGYVLCHVCIPYCTRCICTTCCCDFVQSNCRIEASLGRKQCSQGIYTEHAI